MPAPLRIAVTGEGSLQWNDRRVSCALGRGGVVLDKREGDGGTPVGRFALRRVFYRPDRLAPPRTALPLRAIDPVDGWCDDPGHPSYNRLITKPFPAGHEDLWRADHLYDLIVVLGHNDDPPVPGLGSAIFLHVAGPGYAPTEGCVALAEADLVELLAACGPGSEMVISP